MQKVKIYITSGVNEIGKLPTDQINCDFQKISFDLKVHGLNGKNYRLKINDLQENIIASESKFQIKSNGVSITLLKEKPNDTWGSLYKVKNMISTELEKTIKEDTKVDDPVGSMQNMLKEMYQNGDQQTKSMIAKSWQKANDEKDVYKNIKK